MKESEPDHNRRIPERIENGEPISWAIEDEVGSFSVLENDQGEVAIEIGNKEGAKINLNGLMPKGYIVIGKKIFWKENSGDSGDTSWVSYREKWIYVSGIELRKEGWRYLPIFLHEVGHAVRNEQHPEEVGEANAIINSKEYHDGDPGLVRRYEVLQGRSERNAWAFAIREFRRLTRELDLPAEKIFESSGAFREFINTFLGMKIDSFACQLKSPWMFPPLSEEKKKELLEEVAKLYVHRKD